MARGAGSHGQGSDQVQREACIGCGACAPVCDNGVMEGEKARPRELSVSGDALAKNKEAADVCPVACIEVVE